MAKYEYLSNPNTLAYIDNLKIKVQYTRILILDINDLPIKAIEGQTTGGNISINANSSVRRAGSLTLVVNPAAIDTPNDEIMNKVTYVDSLISMNKRVSIEVGIKNNEFQYPQFDIFWFPLGTFIISNASVTYNNSGIQVSLKLDDKMSLLNGTNSGTLMSAITHSPLKESIFNAEQNKYEEISKPAFIRDIIETLLIEYGEIPKNKIIISDVPRRIQNTVRWGGKELVYINYEEETITTTPPETPDENIKTYGFNDSIGCVNTDFTYPGTLSSNFGESITSVLDKIKNVLGNYEYFFDLDGFFHFQKIKNYLNDGSAQEDLGAAIDDHYFINISGGRSVYNFNDGRFIISYSNNPQYNQIKNDITIWGQKSEDKKVVRYHLIIDKLPKYQTDGVNNRYQCTLYKDEFGVTRAKNAQAATDSSTESVIEVTNWRTELYFGILSGKYTGNYVKEFVEEFPKIYDIENDKWQEEDKSKIDYYFDILNVDSLSENNEVRNFGIEKIGRRGETISNDKVNCVFVPEFQPVVFINEEDSNKEDLKQECILNNQKYIEVTDAIYQNIFEDYFYNSAYDYLRSILHERISYNNNINLTTLPIYYLDANDRITIEDDNSDIHGDYVIKSISIPLALSGNMTINATKAVERI